MENDEMWLPIEGYHNFYEVSQNGQVRSLTRYVKSVRGTTIRVSARILVPKRNWGGYLFVSLSKDGVAKSHYLHRLVANAFIERADGQNYVNHIDGDPTNNRVDNLEWVDHSENVAHAYRINLNKNKGGNHTMSVGIVDNYLGKTFGTIKEWCEARNINYATGRNIMSGWNKSNSIDATLIVRINKEEDGKEDRA